MRLWLLQIQRAVVFATILSGSLPISLFSTVASAQDNTQEADRRAHRFTKHLEENFKTCNRQPKESWPKGICSERTFRRHAIRASTILGKHPAPKFHCQLLDVLGREADRVHAYGTIVADYLTLALPRRAKLREIQPCFERYMQRVRKAQARGGLQRGAALVARANRQRLKAGLLQHQAGLREAAGSTGIKVTPIDHDLSAKDILALSSKGSLVARSGDSKLLASAQAVETPQRLLFLNELTLPTASGATISFGDFTRYSPQLHLLYYVNDSASNQIVSFRTSGNLQVYADALRVPAVNEPSGPLNVSPSPHASTTPAPSYEVNTVVAAGDVMTAILVIPTQREGAFSGNLLVRIGALDLLYSASGSISARPNIVSIFDGTMPVDTEKSLPLNLGTLPRNSSVSKTLTIWNSGDSVLPLNLVGLGTLSSLSRSLPPIAADRAIRLQLNLPTGSILGQNYGEIRLQHAETAEVLSGFVLAWNTVNAAPSNATPWPLQAEYDGRLFPAAASSTIDLGVLTQDAPPFRQLSLRNITGSDVLIRGVESNSSLLTIQDPSLQILKPQESGVMTLQLSTASIGSFQAQLRVQGDATSRTLFTIDLRWKVESRFIFATPTPVATRTPTPTPTPTAVEKTIQLSFAGGAEDKTAAGFSGYANDTSCSSDWNVGCSTSMDGLRASDSSVTTIGFSSNMQRKWCNGNRCAQWVETTGELSLHGLSQSYSLTIYAPESYSITYTLGGVAKTTQRDGNGNSVTFTNLTGSSQTISVTGAGYGGNNAISALKVKTGQLSGTASPSPSATSNASPTPSAIATRTPTPMATSTPGPTLKTVQVSFVGTAEDKAAAGFSGYSNDTTCGADWNGGCTASISSLRTSDNSLTTIGLSTNMQKKWCNGNRCANWIETTGSVALTGLPQSYSITIYAPESYSLTYTLAGTAKTTQRDGNGTSVTFTNLTGSFQTITVTGGGYGGNNAISAIKILAVQGSASASNTLPYSSAPSVYALQLPKILPSVSAAVFAAFNQTQALQRSA
jgi:hypothetical protein